MPRKKRVLCLVLALGILPGIGAAKTDQVKSRWQDAQLKIDGDMTDWGVPSLTSEKAVKVDYAFYNDESNLCVLFIFKDQKYLSSIAQTGMTIWFNSEGKKKKTLGVRFRRKMIPAATVVALMEKKGGPLPAEKKKEIMSKPEQAIIQFMAINKDEEDLTVQFFKDMPEPELQVKALPGRLVYEFAFPIGSLSKLGIAAGKTVTVGFDWGGSTQEMRKAMMGDGSYVPADGSAYPDDFDYDAESLQTLDSDGGMRSMRGPKHYVFWCDLTLAAGK
jgi:hypothetical protein